MFASARSRRADDEEGVRLVGCPSDGASELVAGGFAGKCEEAMAIFAGIHVRASGGGAARAVSGRTHDDVGAAIAVDVADP